MLPEPKKLLPAQVSVHLTREYHITRVTTGARHTIVGGSHAIALTAQLVSSAAIGAAVAALPPPWSRSEESEWARIDLKLADRLKAGLPAAGSRFSPASHPTASPSSSMSSTPSRSSWCLTQVASS